MSSSGSSSVPGSRSQELMSICNLLNPDGRNSALPSSSNASNPSNALLNEGDGPSKEELLRQKRKIQSEKKRQWRRNLTPEQKERRQFLDAQRKREQRMNQTPEQRQEARKKDAARKAEKRRKMKEQMEKQMQSGLDSGSSPSHSSHTPHSHGSK